MKKKMVLGIVIVLVITLITSISYAIWQINLKQESPNTISTSCFKIEFEDENPINLGSAYPTSDEEVSDLTPYTFTITNTCDTYASYQINLEELETSSKRLSSDYLKLQIEDKIANLKGLEKVTPTISGADNSYKLMTGVLEPNEEKIFSIKLWMSEDTPAIDAVMNTSFQSKVSITSTYVQDIIIPYLDNVKTGTIPSKEDKYVFDHYECNNEIELYWDNENWDYTLTNTKATGNQNVCKLYFKTITYEVVLYSETATFDNNKVLTNLIKNGSFEDGFDNWEIAATSNEPGNINTSTTNSGMNSVYINDPNTSVGYWMCQTFTKQPNIAENLYLGFSTNILNFTSSAFQFAISYWKTNHWSEMVSYKSFASKTNGWEHFSTYYQVDITNALHVQVGSGYGNITEGYIDDVYAINLTDTFGSGMEPTQEWVDKYIPYFDTTANIEVDNIEKLETKYFKFYGVEESSIECSNALYKVIGNTLEISNATDNVYCKVS